MQFAEASAAADEQALLALFSDDIMMMADGGGVVNAARRRVYGKERLARLFSIVTRKYGVRFEHFITEVNGETALVTFADGQAFGVNTIDIKDGKITALYRVMNPEKLGAFGDAVRMGERVNG
jgi:RNA polymerase sigma-70 factor (ECF subfamily)